MAASETDALLIEAGAGVGVGTEPDRRRVIFARLAVLLTFLGLWQLVVAVGLVDAFWISTPALIAQELWHLLESGALASDVAVTIYEALLAFVISSALGIICGLLLARSPFWDDVLAPFVLALNSLPRVALAPLIILWFGIGVMAKVVTAFTLVFFILLVNTLGGAKNVDNDIITIARLMGASERDILWKVTFPSALPWIFTGLNLGLTYSLLGVIVAEILALQSRTGLPHRRERGELQHRRGVCRADHARRGRLAVQPDDAQGRGAAAALETVSHQCLSPPPYRDRRRRSAWPMSASCFARAIASRSWQCATSPSTCRKARS